jgi:hypothetical protein
MKNKKMNSLLTVKKTKMQTVQEIHKNILMPMDQESSALQLSTF